MAEQIYAEVTGSASGVTASLDALQQRLAAIQERFEMAARGASTFTAQLQAAKTNSNNLQLGNLSRSLNTIASACEKLKASSGSLSGSLASISGAVNNMPIMDADKVAAIQALGKAFKGLGSSIKATVTYANQFEQALKTIVSAANNMEALNANAQRTLTLLGGVGNAAKVSAKNVQNFGSQSLRSANSLGKLLGMAKRYVVTGLVIHLFSTISQGIGNAIVKGEDFIEQMNYFNIAFGDMATEAGEYYTTISEKLGISLPTLVKYGAQFEQMSKSLGAANDGAYALSTNLVAIGIDLASLTGQSTETAWESLQSGVIAGQYKSLAANFGINVTEAAISQTALNEGIKESVENMTPLEKAYLRYKTVLKAASLANGDMARTLSSPANQARVFQSAVNSLSVAVGNVLIPILNRVMPYITAFIRLLGDAFNAVATLFGFEGVKFENTSSFVADFSGGLDDVEDSASGASGAVSELKKNIMGFDQFNILKNSINDASSGVGGGSGGSSFPMDWGSYDLGLDQLQDSKVGKILDGFKEKLAPLGESLSKLITSLKDLMPELGKFYDQYLAPIGNWVLGEGLPALVDCLTNVTNFLNDHPRLTQTLLALVGALIALKTVGSIVLSIKAYITGLGALGKLFGVGGAAGAASAGTAAAETVASGTLSLSATLAVAGLTVAALYVGGMLLQSYIADEVNKAWEESSPEHKKTIKTAGQTGDMESFQKEVNSKKVTGIKSFFEWYIGGIGDSSKYVEEHLKLDKAKEIIKRSATEMKGSMKTYFSYIESQSQTSNTKMAMNFLTGKSVTTETINAFKRTTGASWEEIRDIIDYNSKTGMTKFNSNLDSGLNQAKGKFRLFNNDLNEVYKTLIDGSFTTVRGIIDNMLNIPDTTNKGIMTGSKNKVKKGADFEFHAFASGGFPARGQLFLANEAGPELIGSIGNKSAVANNVQIIDGVKYGVAAGMLSALKVVGGNDSGSNYETVYRATRDALKEVKFETAPVIIGGDHVADVVIKAINKRTQASGKSPLKV